jgi:putative glutamine amidotransferase
VTVIGITCSFNDKRQVSTLGANYTRAILLAGGIPVILPSLPPDTVPAMLDQIQGLVLSGGGDIDPFILEEDPHPAISDVEPARDAFELALARQAMERNMPLLGICRGAQVLAIAGGGRLQQHLEPDAPCRIQHMQSAPRSHPSHTIRILPGTCLALLVGEKEMRVNSFHHQAVKAVGPGFKVAALASDGVIEAIENPGYNFVLGLQWHLEAQVESCAKNMGILRRFMAACS